MPLPTLSKPSPHSLPVGSGQRGRAWLIFTWQVSVKVLGQRLCPDYRLVSLLMAGHQDDGQNWKFLLTHAAYSCAGLAHPMEQFLCFWCQLTVSSSDPLLSHDQRFHLIMRGSQQGREPTVHSVSPVPLLQLPPLYLKHYYDGEISLDLDVGFTFTHTEADSLQAIRRHQSKSEVRSHKTGEKVMEERPLDINFGELTI